jgi:hypothetical protein
LVFALRASRRFAVRPGCTAGRIERCEPAKDSFRQLRYFGLCERMSGVAEFCFCAADEERAQKAFTGRGCKGACRRCTKQLAVGGTLKPGPVEVLKFLASPGACRQCSRLLQCPPSDCRGTVQASGASTIGTPSSSPANSPAASLQFAIITQPSDLPTRSSATQRGWVTVSAAERGNSDLWTTGIAHGTQKRPGLTHEVNDEDHTCCYRNTGPEDSGRIGGNGQGQGSEMSDQEIIAMLAWCAHGAGSTGPGCRTELQWGQDAVETREKTEPASGFVEFGGLELVGALGDQSGLSDGPESSSGEVDDVSNAVDHALDDALFGGDFANF